MYYLSYAFVVSYGLLSLNTLPGVSTQESSCSCCSVWAWRKPGIKRSWSLSSENYFFVSSLSFQDRVHSLSLLPRSSLFSLPNCAVSFVISLEECLRSRERISCGINYFKTSPQIILFKKYLSFLSFIFLYFNFYIFLIF